MPFGFLHPWFWLGALALAAPLWLHLRRRQETQLLRFSALRFLDDQPTPRRSPLRLRRWFLFALRALALLLLVAAFAWPFLRGANTVPIRESRVYILDNTLSQQANSRFAQARERLVKDLNDAGPDLQVAVVELTTLPRTLVGFGENRSSALQKVRDLQPSFERGSYLAAFRQANALLENSLGQSKRIILLGDNQANQWNENVNTPPFLRDVQVDLPRAPVQSLPNLSLAEPRVQRIFLGDKSLVNLSLKLTHLGPAHSAKLTVQANSQTVVTRTVQLDGQPETLLLQAQWEVEPGAWVRGRALLEGAPDALAADNSAYFALPPVQEGKVALLAQSPYLRLALSPDIMRGQWTTRILDPAALAAEVDTGQDADVLCIESSFLQSAEARKLLWRYLNSGRGVLLLANRVTPAAEACLRDMGFELEGPVRTPPEQPEHVQFVFSNHPIFHPFLSPDFGNLLELKVWQYVRLRATQAMPLMFSESGAGLFFESAKFPGKLFVAAFGLDRDSTSWPVHQTFIPFLDLALQAARAQDPTPVNFEPGESAVVQLPAGATNRQAVLRSDSAEVARVTVEGGRAQFHMPPVPGLYSLSYDDNSRTEKLFSVNPSPKESQLAFVESPPVVKGWHLPHKAGESQVEPWRSTAQIHLPAVLQQHYWWWMVLAGALFLLLELGLADAKKEGK